MTKEMGRKERNWLLAVLLLGVALRLIRLGARDLWYDEAFAVLYAEKSLGAMIYGTIAQVEGAAADVHPLLYYFSLHFWMGLVGQSLFAVRLFSALLGLGAIVLVFYLAAALFDRRTGLIAALLTAISPFHVHYSQEARMYSLLCFLSLLAVYAFVRARQDGGLKRWALFTVAATLSLYTHNLAFLPLLTLDLFVLLKREWRLMKPLCLSHLGMAVLFAPWLSLVPGQFGKVQQAYWIPRPGLAELVRTLMVFHFNLPVPERLMPVVLFFSLLILALAEYRMVRVRGRSAEKEDGLSLVLLLALLPVALMFAISQFKSVYIERGVLAAAVAYYIWIAALLAEVRMPRIAAAVLSAPLLIVLVMSLVYHYTYAGFPRAPFKEAVAYLGEHYQAGDAIVHDNKLTFFPCYYYDRDLPQAFVPDLAGAGSDTLALPTQEALGLFATPLEKAASGHERVWFVIFQKALEEEWFRDLGHSEHPDVAWMEAHYLRLEAVTFNDLDVYLYENP